MNFVKNTIFILIIFNLLLSKFPDATNYNGMVVSSNKYASENRSKENLKVDYEKNSGFSKR